MTSDFMTVSDPTTFTPKTSYRLRNQAGEEVAVALLAFPDLRGYEIVLTARDIVPGVHGDESPHGLQDIQGAQFFDPAYTRGVGGAHPDLASLAAARDLTVEPLDAISRSSVVIAYGATAEQATQQWLDHADCGNWKAQLADPDAPPGDNLDVALAAEAFAQFPAMWRAWSPVTPQYHHNT